MANFGADIIMNGSAMQANESQNARAMLLKLADDWQNQKNFEKQMEIEKQKASQQSFDLNDTAQKLFIKKALDPNYQFTPEEAAIGSAYDAFKGQDQTYIDELGNPVTRKGNRLFGDLINTPIVPEQQDYQFKGGIVPDVQSEPLDSPKDRILRMPIEDDTLSPDQFNDLLLNGETVPSEGGDALPNIPDEYMDMPPQLDEAALYEAEQEGSALPPASDEYLQSPVAAKDIGKANVNLAESLALEQAKRNMDRADLSKYNEGQLAAAGFGNRMKESSKIIDNLGDKAGSAKLGWAGVTEALTGADVTRWTSTPEQKQYLNAARNWIRANLRKESGATIAPEEMAGEYDTYFPIAGDTQEVIDQKTAMRKQTEDSVIAQSAGAYQTAFGKKAQSKKRPQITKEQAIEILRQRGKL